MLSVDDLSVLTVVDGQPRALAAGAGDLQGVTTAITEALACFGQVWLRGLRWESPADLQALYRRLTPRLMRYPGGRVDVTDDGTVQRIADPPSALPLHCELAYTPFRPDLCFFACEQPSRVGGRTLIADGVRVCQALPPALREQLLRRRIRYARVYRTRPWRLLFGVDDIEALAPILGARRDFRYQVRADGSVATEFVIAAMTRVDGQPCFANSLVGLAKGRADLDVTWEDGQAIDEEVLAALRVALRSAQVGVAWARGDLVILDNWRWLHGREDFAGDRVIYSAFGYRA